MADIINPLSWGKTAQNAIDTFIDLWLTGVDILTGGDPSPDVQAPMPFYEAGQGYWFTYNSGVVSNTAPMSYGYSWASVDWVMYTKDDDDRIPYLELECGGLEETSRPSEWNSAVLSYWNKDKIEYTFDDAGIINSGADYIGQRFTADTSDPSAIAGLKFADNTFSYKNIFSVGNWYNFDGTIKSGFNRVDIVQSTGTGDYTWGSVQPVTNGMLHLPRSSNGYWVSISHPAGNETLINNYYDTIKHHNENNQYITDNNYNSYYNTYEVTLKDGTDVNVGFGPAGFGIAVGGVAGGAVGIEPKIDFDDLIDILAPMVDDLNDNAGYDVDIQLHDFDYYLSRYMDYGDFYIKPLHQYDKLPKAQTFDGTIDLGDYPRVIGESVNTYMGLLPAGISVLLSAVFIIAIILDNLRGRR